jgi:hypothetical protein
MMGRRMGATLAAAAWLFVSGAIVYAALLQDFAQRSLVDVARPPAEMKARLWAVALEKLLTAVAMTVIYVWSEQRGSWMRRGLLIGIVAVVMFQIPFSLSVYANMRVALSAELVIAVVDSVRLVIAGLIIATIDRAAAKKRPRASRPLPRSKVFVRRLWRTFATDASIRGRSVSRRRCAAASARVVCRDTQLARFAK